MKSNENIILDNAKPDYGDNLVLGDLYINTGYHMHDIIINSMKEAQVEAIKELGKRWKLECAFGTGDKPIDDIALELIKEIEG